MAEPLVCACPACGTRFRVTAEQLAVADGRVRCGACLTVFDCSDLIPPAARETAAVHAPPERSHTGLFAAAYAAAGCLLAVLVFGLQYPAWSADPGLRRIYEAACRFGPCELPVQRDVAAIAISPGAPVRRPGDSPALAVPVELVNRAPFRQPFPTLAVLTADADGRRIAEQRLAPPDYLPKGHPLEMTRDRPVEIELRIADPDGVAATYRLSVL